MLLKLSSYDQCIGMREFAFLMGAGVLARIPGTSDHWRNMLAIRKEHPSLPRSAAGVLAAFILALGFFALLAVIFQQ